MLHEEEPQGMEKHSGEEDTGQEVGEVRGRVRRASPARGHPPPDVLPSSCGRPQGHQLCKRQRQTHGSLLHRSQGPHPCLPEPAEWLQTRATQQCQGSGL